MKNTIYFEKSSNVAKIWGEMKKPMWVTPIGILGWSLDNGPGLFT